MIVVAGGTGTLGTRLVPLLTDRGANVHILTRDPDRAAPLSAIGAHAVRGDVRNPASVAAAVEGADLVISAVHGFSGPGRVSPASVDQAGNANLITAAVHAGAAFLLLSVVGASPSHPIGLFRAKYDAEQMLRASGLDWTVVRSTAFVETWAVIMSETLQRSGKIMVFGRGNNPVNFVSATDVAALVARAALDSGLRGQVLEIGGPANATFNQFAVLMQDLTGCHRKVQHIPRAALRAMAWLTAGAKPDLARQARAALAMDAIDMTFDAAGARRAFADLPNTDMTSALKEFLT